MNRIEESISKLKRFKYHAIGRLELEDAIDNVVSWYEQMLKDAEETELYWDGDFLAIDLNMAALGYSERDKVRIVILKAEEE